jgi:hypothetical protein
VLGVGRARGNCLNTSTQHPLLPFTFLLMYFSRIFPDNHFNFFGAQGA